jgi:hypothetical protein
MARTEQIIPFDFASPRKRGSRPAPGLNRGRHVSAYPGFPFFAGLAAYLKAALQQ